MLTPTLNWYEIIHFLSVIWLSRAQIWATGKETDSLIRCYSLCIIFYPKITSSFVTSLGSMARPKASLRTEQWTFQLWFDALSHCFNPHISYFFLSLNIISWEKLSVARSFIKSFTWSKVAKIINREQFLLG